jgi:hypothetical protein
VRGRGLVRMSIGLGMRLGIRRERIRGREGIDKELGVRV